ncbi:hypothetical protein DFR52_101993 [Hoeflea marina]|uniref:Peptidase YpeB-like protein n=1 Tax=Hoeflea marina TaxID=274592 RepID=A0A317PS55_9HYPH|nr:PepSY domain-containing protein [Hoeflea marina]PWW04298.1 hypothetical protein DFR52_101993 [Hoeflea marina]
MRQIVLCILAFLVVATTAVRADDDDRNALERAQKSGKVMPLADILEKLKPSIDRPIAGIEFGMEHGAAIYEIYWIDKDGRRREMHVDARTAKILGNEKED